jgi:DNA adenine methylase
MNSPGITNVATVPQRSPFRYPGGKTWLVPEIRAWLRALPRKPEILVEPFAGGGIASLTAAFENLAHRVVMVEKDESVAAVWQIILEDGEWLAGKILEFELTLESVRETLSSPPLSLRDQAFQVILRNRVQRGGIMAPGASLMKAGENGRGLASRWYPGTLARRIRAIYEHRERITFIEGDAFRIIPDFLDDPGAAFFIDPPYTAGGKRAGKRLYTYNEVDHEGLFALMSRAQGDFLMTYDDAGEVEEMARKYDFAVRRAPMKTTHHATLYELLISPRRSVAGPVSSVSGPRTPAMQQASLPLSPPPPVPES